MYSFQVRLLPFGAAVGGFSYLTLQGLLNTPGVGPVLQVIHEHSLSSFNLRVQVNEDTIQGLNFWELCLMYNCNCIIEKNFEILILRKEKVTSKFIKIDFESTVDIRKLYNLRPTTWPTTYLKNFTFMSISFEIEDWF